MTIDPRLRSVVAVRAHVPDEAFTAATLGTLREGSGVVIRETGLVLTIGYPDHRGRGSVAHHS